MDVAIARDAASADNISVRETLVDLIHVDEFVVRHTSGTMIIRSAYEVTTEIAVTLSEWVYR